MLAIGRCLMGAPELIMFDEPSLGLAPLVVQEVLHTIRVLNERGLTILLVEQNVAVSLKISSRAYVLENGRIVMSGPGRASCCTTTACGRPIWASDSALERTPTFSSKSWFPPSRERPLDRSSEFP